MSGRIIAIGDIHGCVTELEKLLGAVSPGPDDRIVLLGDIINRGPDSVKALKVARKYGADAVLGNHERRLIRARNGKRWRKLNKEDLETYEALGKEDWKYLLGMTLTYHVPAMNLVMVHGGFAPGAPWQTQDERTVTRIQVVDKKGRAMKRSEAPAGARHWSEFWTGPEYVVYGHSPSPNVRVAKNSLGLDTGCVYGGSLSALILPEKRIVQVRAAKRYYAPPASWKK